MKKQGFSLIETIVYISILGILFVVMFNTAIVVTNAFGKSRVIRAIDIQGGAILERILREVRLADSVDVGGSILGVNPGKLKLNTVLSAANPTATIREFELQTSTGDVMIKEGTGEAIPLTLGIITTRLVFYSIVASTTSEAVRIEMTFEAGLGRSYSSKDFYGTAVLRGSY